MNSVKKLRHKQSSSSNSTPSVDPRQGAVLVRYTSRKSGNPVEPVVPLTGTVPTVKETPNGRYDQSSGLLADLDFVEAIYDKLSDRKVSVAHAKDGEERGRKARARDDWAQVEVNLPPPPPPSPSDKGDGQWQIVHAPFPSLKKAKNRTARIHEQYRYRDAKYFGEGNSGTMDGASSRQDELEAQNDSVLSICRGNRTYKDNRTSKEKGIGHGENNFIINRKRKKYLKELVRANLTNELTREIANTESRQCFRERSLVNKEPTSKNVNFIDEAGSSNTPFKNKMLFQQVGNSRKIPENGRKSTFPDEQQLVCEVNFKGERSHRNMVYKKKKNVKLRDQFQDRAFKENTVIQDMEIYTQTYQDRPFPIKEAWVEEAVEKKVTFSDEVEIQSAANRDVKLCAFPQFWLRLKRVLTLRD